MDEQMMLEYDDDKKELAEDDGLQDMYLTFKIEDEEFGLSISNVIEIIGIQKITQVPTVPNYIKGIINLRGAIIPVLDIRKIFKKQEKEYDELTCIIVVQDEEMQSIGLIADSVSEVLTIPHASILPPPSAKHQYHNRFVKNLGRIDEDIKMLLDLKNVLNQGII